MPTFDPLTDGEKVPDDVVSNIFRSPPDAPARFLRSSLIVGARGSGKTLLLRQQKATHKGICPYFSLSTEFASITKLTGQGPLAFDTPAGLESAIPGKAVSLLSLSLVKRLLDKGILIDQDAVEALFQCLPTRYKNTIGTLNQDALLTAKRNVAIAEIAEFAGISEERPLSQLVSQLGHSCQKQGRPLLLLFDKADQVTPPATVPIIELLDQSSGFTALMAIRPGYTGKALEELSRVILPGDHYDICHLGIYPRSNEWRAFAEAAVQSQLAYFGIDRKYFEQIDPELRAWVFAVSRDSLRVALKLFSRGMVNEQELKKALIDEQGLLLKAAESALPNYLPRSSDLDGMLKLVRKEVASRTSVLVPVRLSITKEYAKDLFDKNDNLDRFIEAGLRCGSFCLPEGQRWAPGTHARDIEISPLLAIDHQERRVASLSSPPIVIEKREGELKGAFGGTNNPPVLFVAYRMNNDKSKTFRSSVESAIKAHPDLRHVEVTDGHVPAGTKNWAESIRNRIAKSRVIVGDVTGLRSEVLFEMGFAYGLNRPYISAVATRDHIDGLPSWIRQQQLAYFDNEHGLRNILEGVASVLGDTRATRGKALPSKPGKIVWLRNLEWGSSLLKQFQYRAKQEDRGIDIVEDHELNETQLLAAAKASLLVAELDGTEHDAFVHYACGAIVANPKTGVAVKLPRLVLLLVSPERKAKDLVAEGLSRCTDTVKIVRDNDLIDQVSRYLKKYDTWAQSGQGLKKNAQH